MTQRFTIYKRRRVLGKPASKDSRIRHTIDTFTMMLVTTKATPDKEIVFGGIARLTLQHKVSRTMAIRDAH